MNLARRHEDSVLVVALHGIHPPRVAGLRRLAEVGEEVGEGDDSALVEAQPLHQLDALGLRDLTAQDGDQDSHERLPVTKLVSDDEKLRGELWEVF